MDASWACALALALGLRHAVDPDHLSAIDALSYRARAHPMGAWVGLGFALGHGGVVSAGAVLTAACSAAWVPPEAWLHLTELLPPLILGALALNNLWALSQAEAALPAATWWARWPGGTHPWGWVLAGASMALVMDTASQAAAWGLAASLGGGWPIALALGCCFTLGMASLDALDGWLMRRVYAQGLSLDLAPWRRALAWVTSVLSLGYAGWLGWLWVHPGQEAPEVVGWGLSALLIGLALLAGAVAWRQGASQRTQAQPS